MTKDETLKKIKSDSRIAELSRCGGCTIPLSAAGTLTEKNIIIIKGKSDRNDPGEEAFGVLCNECLKDEQKVKDGPLEATRLTKTGDRVVTTSIINLLDYKTAKEVAKAAGTTAAATTTTATRTAAEETAAAKRRQ